MGDGLEHQALVEFAEKERLGNLVEWAVWHSQEEVAELMRASDVYVLPSSREFGVGVVAETMASGLVPIVVDYGASGCLVSEASYANLP